MQVLRSVSTWSAGIKQVEKSIHSAYEDVIKNAKHYIYIEVSCYTLCILYLIFHLNLFKKQ